MLKNEWTAEIEDSSIKVHLPFGWNLRELGSTEGLTGMSIGVSLNLVREKGLLWGTFGEIDCPELEPVCGKWVIRWLNRGRSGRS